MCYLGNKEKKAMFLVVSRSDVHFGFDQPFLGEKNYFGKHRAPRKKLVHPCWGQELGNSVLDISKNLLTENLYENKNGLEWWQLFESSTKAINLNYWHLLTDVMILTVKYSGLKMISKPNWFPKYNFCPWFEKNKFKHLLLVSKVCHFPISKHPFNQDSVYPSQ